MRLLPLTVGRSSQTLDRYVQYKSEHGLASHKKYFLAHKDEEWLRQQFDPRRLEVAYKQRAEAAVVAAADFDVAAVQSGVEALATGPAVRLAPQRGSALTPTSLPAAACRA